MQTAVKAVYHDHCYVIPHKQGATSLLFPSVSGLNTRIQGGKVVVVTSPDIQHATTSHEGKQEEEEELNEGIAHDHGYYHSNSDESQDEKPESSSSSGKSSIALDLPHPVKSGGAIAFDPTSSNMSFPDCQFSTLPAQIFAQDEEESPMVDGHPAPKLELSPEALTQQYVTDQMRFAAKEAAEGKKRQRKTSVNVKTPPPEPPTPTRKGARQRKPSTKVREMQEEAEEKDTKKQRKRKAVISIARPERQLSLPADLNRTTVHSGHTLMGSTLVSATSPVSPQPREITDIIQEATSPKKVKKMTEESISPKASPKKAAVKKKKKDEVTPDKSDEVTGETAPIVEAQQPKDETEEVSQAAAAAAALPTSVQPQDTRQESTSPQKSKEAEPVQKSLKRARSIKSTEGTDGSSMPTSEAKEEQTPAKRGRATSKTKGTEKASTDEARPDPTKEDPESEKKPTRGRLAKNKPQEQAAAAEPELESKTPGRRGRPRKGKVDEDTEKDSVPEEEPAVTEPEAEPKTPGRRGRPRKDKTQKESNKESKPEEESTVTEPEQETKAPERRGRPRKSKVEEEKEEVVQDQQPSRRGRPRKSDAVEEGTSSVSEQETKTPGRRGRPKKTEVTDPPTEQVQEPEVETEIKSVTRRGRPRKGKETEEDAESEQTPSVRQSRSRNSESSEQVAESKESEVAQTPSRRGRPRKTPVSQEPSDTGNAVKEPEGKVTETATEKGEGDNAKIQPEQVDDDKAKDIGTGDAKVVTGTKQSDTVSPEPEPKKRGRGRPPKLKPKSTDVSAISPPSTQTDSHKDRSTAQPQQSLKTAIPATVASTPTGTVGRGRGAKATPQTEKAEPAKRGRKRKSEADTVDDDADAQSEELTIRFIPNKDVTKAGNHWGQAVPSDLLLRVFQQVISTEGSFPFLSRVSKVCRLWYEVGHHPSLWTAVDLTAPCVKKYKKSLNSLCKRRISDSTNSLNLSGWSSLTDSDLEVVVKHCKNLETLNVSGCNKLSSTSLRLLATHCKHLANIDLSEAWPTSGQHDKSAQSLCELVEALGTGLRSLSVATTALTHPETLLDALMLHCPNLERLNMSNCLFGNYMMKLPLERLQEACPLLKVLLLGNSLFQAKDPTNKELAKCPGFVNLETLDVSCNSNNANKMRFVTDDVLKRLLRNAFDLRQLDISGCKHVTSDGIEALPIVSLKKLNLGSCRAVTQPNFVDVVLKWGHSLQQLDLSGNSIDEQVVVRLIDGCPNLSHINLSGCRGLPMQTRRDHRGDNVIAVLRHTLDG